VVSVVRVVGSVLLVVGSVVELLVDELVGGTVVLVEVVAVVVVRLAGETLVGGSVAEVGVVRLDRGVLTGVARLVAGATVTFAWALRWRGTTVVVATPGSASARCRGLVTNPARLPPTAPMRTAAITEVHRRDSTNRIGLKTGSPRAKLP